MHKEKVPVTFFEYKYICDGCETAYKTPTEAMECEEVCNCDHTKAIYSRTPSLLIKSCPCGSVKTKILIPTRSHNLFNHEIYRVLKGMGAEEVPFR